MVTTNKVINYDITEPVYFLNNTYLRDDRQLKNITVKVTNISSTDQLTWNDTLREDLGIDHSNMSYGVTTLHIFSADISDELEWEAFLMSFSFLQSAMRAADRNAGNRTINVIAEDCSNSVAIMIIINVLPRPPEVIITVQNTTFTEGQDPIVLRDEFPIAVRQDQDALFVSLIITLQ